MVSRQSKANGAGGRSSHWATSKVSVCCEGKNKQRRRKPERGKNAHELGCSAPDHPLGWRGHIPADQVRGDPPLLPPQEQAGQWGVGEKNSRASQGFGLRAGLLPAFLVREQHISPGSIRPNESQWRWRETRNAGEGQQSERRVQGTLPLYHSKQTAAFL